MAWIAPNSLKADKTSMMNGVKINEYLLAKHNTNKIDLPVKRKKKLLGVVIHNTDSAGSADDGRQYTAATLNNNVTSRTHYYITHLSAWQNLSLDEMNWTCGDGTMGNGNGACISLEIIMNGRSGTNNLKARDNGARIAAYLLYSNGLTVNDMYTHNYFLNVRNGVKGNYNYLCTTPTPTRNCPYYIVWDWDNFRREVDAYIKKLGGKSVMPEAPKADTAAVFKAGDKVKIKSSAATYAGAASKIKIPKAYKGDKHIYTVARVDGDRSLIQELYSWVNNKDLTKV